MEEEEFDEGVVVGQLPTVAVSRHINKRSLRNKALSIGFNDKDLRDYVTGFHKRKKKRRKEAQRQSQQKDRLKRIAIRKQRKLGIEFAAFGGASEDPGSCPEEPNELGGDLEDATNLNALASVSGTKMYENEDTKITVTTTELSNKDDTNAKAVDSTPNLSSSIRAQKNKSLLARKKPMKRVIKQKSRKKKDKRKIRNSKKR